jgi:hypothetical protein
MTTRHRAGLVSVAAWIAAFVLLPGHGQAEGRSEVVVEHIHSNLPLYGFDWEGTWPRSFFSEDEFGCTSRVGFGDWHFVPAASNHREEDAWERFDNYGVFHCAAVMRRAGDRADLETAPWEYGLIVRIGKARHRSTDWELWALQRGMRAGSDYTLLAREAKTGDLVDEFQVLQQHCPRGMLMEAKGFDVWITRYCAIDSRAELLSLARRMLRLPPRGTIQRVAKDD